MCLGKERGRLQQQDISIKYQENCGIWFKVYGIYSAG